MVKDTQGKEGRLKISQCVTFILNKIASVVLIWQKEEHFFLVACYSIGAQRLQSEEATIKHS